MYKGYSVVLPSKAHAHATETRQEDLQATKRPRDL